MKRIVSLLVVVMATSGCLSNAESRGHIDLLGFTDAYYDQLPLLKAVDATAELCGPSPLCVQAVRLPRVR